MEREHFVGFVVGVGVTVAAGVALGFEKPLDTNSPEESALSTELSANESPESLPEVEITLPGTTAVANTVKIYPLSGLACEGEKTTFTVDSAAYFESTGQYSVLVALENRFANPSISTNPSISSVDETFALNLSTDIAQDNGIQMDGFDPNNFPTGTFAVYTDCGTSYYLNLIP